jgi:uncharacterized OsmC-like protein
MAMLMGMAAQKLGVDLTGLALDVETDVAPGPPMRVESLHVTATLPRKASEEHKTQLIAAAETCPFRGSLRPEVQVRVDMVYRQ